MSKNADQRHKALRKLTDVGKDYEVGYGKPPVSARFKKGKSGNPKGRPKGSKNRLPYLNEERLKDIIIAEAYRDINVVEGGKSVTYPMAQAIVRSLAVNAAKGQARAQELFTELLSSTETSNKRLYAEYFDSMLTYKIEWEKELEDRQRTGRQGPEPIPHPDHIVVDMNTGRVHMMGPFTKEEKVKFDRLRESKASFLKEIEDLKNELATETDPGMRRILEDDLRRDEELVAMIRRVIPG